MRSAGGAFIAGLLLAGPAAADPATPAELVAVAETVLSHEAALSRVWAGFWPAGQPFIIHDPETGAVFAGAAAPAGPEFRPGPLAGARSGYELDYPSGVPNTVALKYAEDVADLSTLFHEQFHDYQRDAFRWIGAGHDEFVDLELIPDRAAFAAAADIERRVLAAALSAPDPADRRRLAARYLALRAHRLDKLDPAIAAAEAHREWSEGTAQYVGLQGAAIIAGEQGQVEERIIEGLHRDITVAGGGFAVNWFRWRSYDIGAGLAWLLDDLGLDWRRRVERGERLDALLAEALGGQPADADGPALLRIYDFDRLVPRMAERLERSPAAPVSRAEFLATAPRRLVIEIEATPARRMAVETSFQAVGMTPLPNGALALADVGYFLTELGTANLRITDRSVLMEDGPLGPRHIVLLSSFEGLENLGNMAGRGAEPAPLSLELDWIQLEAAAATVEVGEDEIRLRLIP